MWDEEGRPDSISRLIDRSKDQPVLIDTWLWCVCLSRSNLESNADHALPQQITIPFRHPSSGGGNSNAALPVAEGAKHDCCCWLHDPPHERVVQARCVSLLARPSGHKGASWSRCVLSGAWASGAIGFEAAAAIEWGQTPQAHTTPSRGLAAPIQRHGTDQIASSCISPRPSAAACPLLTRPRSSCASRRHKKTKTGQPASPPGTDDSSPDVSDRIGQPALPVCVCSFDAPRAPAPNARP